VTDPQVQDTLLRYIDQYQWGWGVARKLINRTFQLDLQTNDLQRLYRASKQKQTASGQ